MTHRYSSCIILDSSDEDEENPNDTPCIIPASPDIFSSCSGSIITSPSCPDPEAIAHVNDEALRDSNGRSLKKEKGSSSSGSRVKSMGGSTSKSTTSVSKKESTNFEELSQGLNSLKMSSEEENTSPRRNGGPKSNGYGSGYGSRNGESKTGQTGNLESVTSTPFVGRIRKKLELDVTAIPGEGSRDSQYLSSDSEDDDVKDSPKKVEEEEEEEYPLSESDNTAELEELGAVGGRPAPIKPRIVNLEETDDDIEVLANNIDRLAIQKPRPPEKFPAVKSKARPDPLVKFIPFEDLPQSAAAPKPSAPKFITPESKRGVDGTINMICELNKQMPQETDKIEKDPKGLLVPLYPHQKYGLKWLYWRERNFPGGGILADEMGLGKTLMIIALALKSKNADKLGSPTEGRNGWVSAEKNRKLTPSKTTLVVCPASVLDQWESEIKNKASGLKSHIFHGPKRTNHSSTLVQYDFVITTYQTLGSEIPKDEYADWRSPLLKINWERIVLDEGHQIRNQNTIAAQACYKLNARYRWVVTGTPVHNSPSDMYSLVQFLKLNPFDDKKTWENWIGMKITKTTDNMQRLQAITSSLLIRRMKKDVILTGKADGSIPEKTVEEIEVELSPSERQIYDHLHAFAQSEMKEFLRQKDENELQKAADRYVARGRIRKPADPDKKTFSHIWTLFLRLQQTAVLPHLIHSMLEDENSEVQQVDGEDPLAELAEEDIISRKNPVFSDDFESAKLKRVFEDLEGIRAEGIREKKPMDKVIIVSKWTTLLGIVSHHLKARGFSYTRITGEVKIGDRMDIMSRFNSNRHKPQVMLLSLQAGGVGLNLVGANYLFFLDLHYNPQLELQAQDRIHRFGQTKPVFIRRYVASDTIEARIKELQDKKLELANGIMGSKSAAGALSIQDMKKIFDL